MGVARLRVARLGAGRPCAEGSLAQNGRLPQGPGGSTWACMGAVRRCAASSNGCPLRQRLGRPDPPPAMTAV